MDTVSINLAKFTKPRLPKILPRQRLFRLLDESRTYPATWVSGPGGSGKTTLLAHYIEENNLPCLWYQIDAGDRDIATFFYYMGFAGQKIASRRKTPMPLLTPEYALGIAEFTRRFFEELFDRLEKPGMLVLDNFQNASPDSLLGEVLREALSVVPGEITTFILSRGQPPPELARIRANNTMNEIGWPELRLIPEETRDLTRLLDPACSEERMEILHAKTDGWIAGLILLSRWPDMEEIDVASYATLTESGIFDYFASEIFERADGAIRQFLLKTSLFPQMTARMAEKLTGMKFAEQIFSRLRRDHWFTNRCAGRQTRYQYHPLFREFLLSRVLSEYSEGILHRMKKDAAALLEEDGQIEAAVDLFFESESVEEAVRLILGRAGMLVLQGRIQTLEHWLNRLPGEVLEAEPWLMYWLGVCHLPIEPSEGKQLFESALHLFEDKRERPGIFYSMCGVLDSITYTFGSFRELDLWILKMRELSSEFESLFSDEIQGKVAFSMLHALVLRQPDHPAFQEWEKRGILALQSGIPAEIKTQALLPLVLHRTFVGDLIEAQHFINFYRELAKAPDITPLALLTLKDLEAFYYWTKGDFTKCSEAVSYALELASTTGVHIVSPFLLSHGAAGALSSGDFASAAEYLEKLNPYAGLSDGWIREFFHTLELWRALLEKDLPKARLQGELLEAASEQTGCPLSAPVDYLGFAIALHASGKTKEASGQLDRAFQGCRRIRSRQMEFACFLADAEFALDSGNEARAVDSLRKAMLIGKEEEYVNTWFWRPDVMTRLCCKALEANIEVAYVQNLIARRGLMPENPPLTLDNWPWALKIFTLGEFRINQNEKPLTFPGKTHDKPLVLLKTIIALGGRNISESRITDSLWPESDGDIAHGAFKTTLHRLRRLLGHHEAVSIKDGRITLNPKYCWLDAWALEEILSEADTAWRSATKEDSLMKANDLTRKAMDFYNGPFLSGEHNGLSLREHLHDRFLRAVIRLGDYLQKRGEWEEAIEIYEATLKKDELVEACYRGLMVCNYQLGYRDRVLSSYDRCRKVMARGLGVRPSSDTEALRDSLLFKNT